MTLNQKPGFVVCVPIRHDPDWPGLAAREVQAELEALGNPVTDVVRQALDASGGIHFMSLSVIWEGRPDDPPILLVDLSGDGVPAEVLRTLIDFAGPHLVGVFRAACGVEDPDDLLQLLLKHVVTPKGVSFSLFKRATGLAFQGTPDLTVRRILEDDRIAEIAYRRVRAAARSRRRERPLEILAAVKEECRAAGLDVRPAAKVRRPERVAMPRLVALIAGAFVRARPGLVIGATLLVAYTGLTLFVLFFDGVLRLGTSDAATKLLRRLSGWESISSHPAYHLATAAAQALSVLVLGWASFVLAALGLVVFVGLLVGGLAILLRIKEAADPAPDIDPSPASVAAAMRRENAPGYAQNHLTAVSTVKDGPLRLRVFLVIGLQIVELCVRANVFKKGFLADVGTIHFAQWVRLPGTRKLVFLSNYDGSWQSYLEDFISMAKEGVTGIWSNTVGFPRARWLFFQGAVDGDRFKRWARRQQIPTLAWYSAYPKLSVDRIRNNVEIRSGLATITTPTEAAQWLKLFGSTPSETVLDTHEVQGLVLDSYREFLEGACIPIAFEPRSSVKSRRAALDHILDHVTFKDSPLEKAACFLAVSARGVEGLGGYPLASDFPAVFNLGMAHPTRAEVLGDVGRNAPETWEWGGPDTPVDMVLLLYGKTPADLAAKRAAILGAPGARVLRARPDIPLEPWPAAGNPITEPFGFTDGVSQPYIRGVSNSKTVQAEDIVEPGEFILGYKDGRDEFPPTPQVDVTRDHCSILPELPSEFPGKPERGPPRDLGRNGSFLVIRQLRQDTEGFKAFLDAAATKLHLASPQGADWIAAKMIGRWKNGAPVVGYPDAEPAGYGEPENDFRYGRDDPQGQGCPLGAHIRRANPRDSFDPSNPEQMFLSSRHRLLRRGRAYIRPDDANPGGPPERGLVFMCFNADIERQFEFVQQTWISSPSFSGLREEADPIVAPGRGRGCFTIPTREGIVSVEGLQSWVTVRGGGYFFLPSRRALHFLAQVTPESRGRAFT